MYDVKYSLMKLKVEFSISNILAILLLRKCFTFKLLMHKKM